MISMVLHHCQGASKEIRQRKSNPSALLVTSPFQKMRKRVPHLHLFVYNFSLTHTNMHVLIYTTSVVNPFQEAVGTKPEQSPGQVLVTDVHVGDISVHVKITEDDLPGHAAPGKVRSFRSQ